MQKQLGSIMLVSGTCIGSGMIALPMVLAKIGLIPSIFLMLIIWGTSYYSALLNLELNLQAGRGLSLGELGQHFSGPIAKAIGVISLKLLSYALLAVFIYGGSSVVQKLILSTTDLKIIATIYASLAVLVLMLPIQWVDYINRFLFISLIGVVAILVVGLTSMVTWADLPLIAQDAGSLSSWRSLIPVVFTSFGFQVIFHTLTNYCHRDPKMLKKAFFWGSLIPAIVYLIWTCSMLSVIFHENNDFYEQMIKDKIEVGDLIKELSNIAKWPTIQVLVWWISLLAVVTSVIGVGVGLCESIRKMLPSQIKDDFNQKALSASITIVPAYLVVILVPNAFIAVLGFAGMILVIIAILLPLYLLNKAKVTNFYYKELKSKGVRFILMILGIIIIGCEVVNMLI